MDRREQPPMKDQKQNRARALGMLGKIPFNGMLGIEISRLHDDGVTLRCKVRQ